MKHCYELRLYVVVEVGADIPTGAIDAIVCDRLDTKGNLPIELRSVKVLASKWLDNTEAEAPNA